MGKESRAFLEANADFKPDRLRFVTNALDDEINALFTDPNAADSTTKFKTIKPIECMCIKSFKQNTHEKFFINLCQSDAIIAPKDLTEEELLKVLESSEPNTYRVPMSISEPRLVKDKSGNMVDVCDVAVHPNFAARCVKSPLYKSFTIALLTEAISEKYNVQISQSNAIILVNRKSLGTLVTHQIRDNVNDQPKAHLRGDTTDNTDAATMLPLKLGNAKDARASKALIEVLDEVRNQDLRGKDERSEPEYRLLGKTNNNEVVELHAEFHLPKCVTAQELSLAIGEDRIVLECRKHGYAFDKFVEQALDQERARASFDKTTRMLRLQVFISAV